VRNGLPLARDVETLGATKIGASPYPDWVVVSDDRIWVSGVGAGLVCYDAATHTPLSEHQFDNVSLDMDLGFGSVWVGSGGGDGAVLGRVDANTGRVVARIGLPTARLAEESSVGAGEDGVWVLSDDVPRRLIVVDPRSDQVRDVFPAPEGAAAVRAGLGAVWITTDTGTLVRLDPSSGEALVTVPVGGGARFLALTEQAVWVMNQTDGTVSRIDPDVNRVVATIRVSEDPILGGDIAATDASVWVRVTDALAVRIDPATNGVTDRLGPSVGSGCLGIAHDSVWITAHDVLSIWRVPIP
jgi:YVTN family beta-propeller protein